MIIKFKFFKTFKWKKILKQKNFLLFISTMYIIFFTGTYIVIYLKIRKVDPVGGASRFVHLVKKLKKENENCLILFSGDIYSPSESRIYNLSF